MPNWKKVITSGSNAHLNHITASGDISSSGTITMLTASIGGGIFTSASLAAGGGGGGAVSAVANGSNNRVATFSSGDALNGEANLTFDGSTLSVTGNQTISTHITASGNISASGTILGDAYSIQGESALGFVSPKGMLFSDGNVTQLDIGKGGATTQTNIFGNITASNNISSSGTIVANELQDTSLTENRLTLVGANGVLTDNSNFTVSSTKLTALSFGSTRGAVINEDGHSSGDFRVEGDTDTHLIFADASADKLAIGTNTVGNSLLTIDGDVTTTHITASGNISASGNAAIIIGKKFNLDNDSNSTIVFNGDDGLSTVGKSGNTVIFGQGGDWTEVQIGRAPDALKNISVLGPITASANISASGTGSFSSIVTSGNINTSADLFVDDITADDITADKIITDEIDATSNGNLTIDVGEDSSVFITMDDGSTTPFEFKTAAGGSPTQELGITGNFLLDTSGDITLDAAGDQINFKDNGSTRLTFNLDSTPELDVTGDFIIDGSGGIKLDSATSKIEAIGNITASGNISSSGDIIATGDLNLDGKSHFEGNITASGNISSSGDIINTGNITTDGILDITNTTDSSNDSGDTGALRVEGGASIAKKLYVGTDLDVDGTTNLDAVDIDSTVQIDGATTFGVDGTGYFVKFFGDTSGRYMKWVDNSDHLKFRDNTKIAMGNRTSDGNADFYLYHDGSNTLLEPQVGDLIVSGSGTTLLEVKGNISASGTITMLTASIGGGIFTSASLAAGGGGGGSMNNFTLTADGGSNQTIADGNTLDIAGGTNITTAVGATDTVTINLDASPNVTSISASGAVTASVISSSGEIFCGDASSAGSVGGFRTTTANANGLYEAGGRLIISCSDDLIPTIGDDCFFTNAGNSVFTIKGGEQRVGINKTTPGQALEVVGNITASGTITSSGINIIGSGTAELEVAGKITASGNIVSYDEIDLKDGSAGGDTLVRMYASNDDGIIDVYQNNAVMTRIAGNGTSFFKDNEGVLIGPGSTIAAQSIGGSTTSLTVQGHTSMSGELYVDHRVFDTGSTTLGAVGGGMGDIVKFGGTTTIAGAIYQLKSAGTWALTDADAAADATGSIAVALGTNSTTNGMLLRGMAKLNHDPGGGIGAPLYLSVNAGSSSNAAPTGNNDIARIIGYNIDTSGKIYFNPDNTFVEVSA